MTQSRTESAPHGDSTPSSRGVACEVHETMEHLRARATEPAAYDVGTTTGPEVERNRTVPAPVHAPLVDTPASHLRNALQIFYGANMGTASAPLFALSETEQHDVFRRVVLALVEIETQRARRREILRQTIRRRTETLAADLQHIDRTNRELAGDPSVLLELSVEPGAGSGP